MTSVVFESAVPATQMAIAPTAKTRRSSGVESEPSDWKCGGRLGCLEKIRLAQ